MTDSAWTQTGKDEITLMAREDLCEVFDFSAKKRVTMVKEGPGFSMSETCFTKVSATELAEAATQLRKQGGADHSRTVAKLKV